MSSRRKNNQKKANFKKTILKLNQIKHPILWSLFWFIVWEVIAIIVGVIALVKQLEKIKLVDGSTYIPKIEPERIGEIIAGIAFSIGILWLLVKWGILENARLKFRNWRNKKIIKLMDKDLAKHQISKYDISLEEFRTLNQKRSWYGLSLLLGINFVALLICIIIDFI